MRKSAVFAESHWNQPVSRCLHVLRHTRRSRFSEDGPIAALGIHAIARAPPTTPRISPMPNPPKKSLAKEKTLIIENRMMTIPNRMR